MICNIATTCAAETLGSVARQIMIWCESIFFKLSFLLYGGPNRVRVCQGEKEDLLKSLYLAVNRATERYFLRIENYICAVKRNLHFDTGADSGLF